MLKMGKRLFKNLISGPATRLTNREPFEKQRGHIDIEIEKCIFCGRCSRECPSGCIKVDRKIATWEINPFECIICGVCVEACPTKALFMYREYREPAYQKELKDYKGKLPVKPAKETRSGEERGKSEKKSAEKKDSQKNEVA